MRTPPRKVVIVSTSDRGGGMERIAWLLRAGLEQRGTDAWLVVGQKLSNHPRVVAIHESPFIDYRPYGSMWIRHTTSALRLVDRRLGLEDFRYPFSWRLLEMTGEAPDVVVACNLHGGYFDLRALAALSRHVPVVVLSGDGWLMTGHCAVPMACSRWQSGCGRCPDLSRFPAVARDATAINWRRKRNIYRSARWSLVAPSAWHMDRLDRSIVHGAAAARRVIPNGVDQSIFCPGSRDDARRTLGLALERPIGLAVANLGSINAFKDFVTLRAALARLSERRDGRALDVLLVGAEGASERFGTITLHHHRYCAALDRLACYYRAADFLLHPTHEETFGNVVAEAMSCACPVIATRIAAVPELVAHGETGLLVEPGDAGNLARTIEHVLDDDRLRARLGMQGYVYAKAKLSADLMIDRYLEVLGDAVADLIDAPSQHRAAVGAADPRR